MTRKLLALTLLAAAAFAVRPLAADSLSTTDGFLPIVRIVGATGTYVSDVTVFNPGAQPAEVTFYFTPADTDGTSSPGRKLTPNLAAGETVTVSDILTTLFATTGYGLLEVLSTQPIIVTSNTINVSTNCTGGTFGQFSPVQPGRNAVGFGSGAAYGLYVAGIRNDADHRTNAVIMNPTSATLHATMELSTNAGVKLGQTTVDVPPYSLHQFNDVFGAVFASLNPPVGAAWRLNFRVNTAGSALLLAYVTITDKRSGDPYLVTASAMAPDVPQAVRAGEVAGEPGPADSRTEIEGIQAPPRR